MNKKGIVFVIATGAIFLGFTTFIFAKDPKPQKDDLYEQVELFASAVSIIRSDYVEDVTSKDLIYGALKGMLMSLDSHSQFMDPDTYREMRVETEGKFGGLGIEITIKDGILTIISPIEGTPAFKAGLRPNDKVVKIDGVSTKDITLTEAVKKLRGEPGTSVTLTVLREEEKEVLDVVVVRGIIEIRSIKEASILEDKVGYVRVVEFQENTPKDLAKALVGLKAKGMDSLILDLRNNPGGLLNISAKVSEMFLPQGKMVVSTKGRVKNQDMIFKSTYGRPYLDFPLIVLVNEGSASASEIVAGALRDNKRGIVVGTKTFGKGSVQTVIPLPDGSAIRLTTAVYFTPSGQAINNKGIVPDVVIEKPKEIKARYSKDKDDKSEEEVFEKAEPESKEKVEEKEIKLKMRDAQLQAAIDLIKGIKAYESLKTQQKK
jgi:carboxyl-terminal processing protease